MNHPPSSSRIGQILDTIEETSIAICLGLMTLLTFANVIARYVFNSNILWALEMTVYLFAWLVLMGASYGVKKHIHIGVDVVINMVSPLHRKILGLIAASACIIFSVMLLVGSWNYWYPFATERAWLETQDVPMPDSLRFIETIVNECGVSDSEQDTQCRQVYEDENGYEFEPIVYEKIPRFLPYLALPLGISLLTLRFFQLGWKVLTGELDKIIASHEVEDELQEVVTEENSYQTSQGEKK